MVIRLINFIDTERELLLEVRNWRNSLEVTQYFIIENISYETHENWLENKIKKGLDQAFIIYDDNQPQGCVYLKNIDLKNKTAEFGIFLKPNVARDKNIGTIATHKILEYGFDCLCLEKICLEVLSFNHRAIHLYKKFNFQVEGILRSHVIKDNKRTDVHLMGLLRNDWYNNTK